MISDATQEDIEEHVYGEVLEDRLRELQNERMDAEKLEFKPIVIKGKPFEMLEKMHGMAVKAICG